MKRSINAINLLIITVIFLSGCVTSLSDSMTDSSATSSISSRTPKAIEETPNATSSSLAIQPSMTPTPEIHITPSASQPESASTVQPTVSPETTTTIEVMVRDDCPKLVTSETLPRLWTDGSVLFSTEQPGIWAISADNLSPQLVYEIPPEQGNWVILSTDGSKLARFERSNPEVLYEGTTVIYDLIAQEESRVPAPVDTWFQLWDWLPDGRIRYLTRIELTPNIGQVREFFLVNPSTMQTETVVEELNLPGFTFDERNIQLGFASLDPSKQLVLYTKSSERGDDVVLLDLQSNTVIWEQEGTVGGLFSEPRWAADGSRIVFGMPDPETTGDYIRLYSVTRDGQVEKLPPQPLPETDKFPIRYAITSPDGHYVHYGLWYSRFEGPGFILDTATGELGELCDPSTTFLDGQWITESQLLYRVRKDDSSLSLRILDVHAWTAQVLVESNANSMLNVIGWTPIEFPES